MDHTKEFKNMCRGYNAMKRRLEAIEKEAADPVLRSRLADRYEILSSVTDEVDRVLEGIGRTYGSSAAEMISALYIRRESEQTVAERYGMSARTMYRKCREYLEGVR
ncbi:MAG: hypothetical protein K6G61_10565 [Solobacterium sp.]|nr:hypothetical protein [Solobacterium sp.]